jgi:hypothetical protein
MEHFANFGIVKRANKIKKNDFLLKKGEDLYASSQGSGTRRLLDEGYTLGSILDSHGVVNDRRLPLPSHIYDDIGWSRTRTNGQLPPSMHDSGIGWSRANVEFPQKPVKELPQYLAGKNRAMFLGEARKAQRKAQGLPELMRKPTTGEYAESRLTPNTDAFTDVRKTDDLAASRSGYLGFRKDPFKGYGGMMEEPVDLLKSGSKARIPY